MMYFGYLEAIRISTAGYRTERTFLIFNPGIDKGIITEEEAQEMIDHLTMKFNMQK